MPSRWTIPIIVITPPAHPPPPRASRRPADADRLWAGWRPRSVGHTYIEDEYDVGLVDAIVAVFGLSVLATYWAEHMAPVLSAAVAPLGPLVSSSLSPLSSSTRSFSSSSSLLFSPDDSLCLPGIHPKTCRRARARLAPLALFAVLVTATLALTAAFHGAQLFPGLEARSDVGLFLPQHHYGHGLIHAHAHAHAHSYADSGVWDSLPEAPAHAAYSPPVTRDKLVDAGAL